MMMITTSGNKCGLRAEFLLQFKTQNAAVKFQRAVEVGNFQVNVADGDASINRLGSEWLFHAAKIVQPAATRDPSSR